MYIMYLPRQTESLSDNLAATILGRCPLSHCRHGLFVVQLRSPGRSRRNDSDRRLPLIVVAQWSEFEIEVSTDNGDC